MKCSQCKFSKPETDLQKTSVCLKVVSHVERKKRKPPKQTKISSFELRQSYKQTSQPWKTFFQNSNLFSNRALQQNRKFF